MLVCLQLSNEEMQATDQDEDLAIDQDDDDIKANEQAGILIYIICYMIPYNFCYDMP